MVRKKLLCLSVKPNCSTKYICKMKKYNFCSGPSILPKTVFEQAANAILDFNNTGLSILEISHRSADFDEILQDARQRVKQLMQLNSDYEVLFLQGGASSQFMMIPFNILPKDGTAGIIDTGTWSQKAIKEANILGKAEVVATSEDKGYNYIPKNWQLPRGLSYLHITTNNTIYGSQFFKTPDVDIPLVADMSSDIFSRPWSFEKYDLIYAGAQKNIGPAGATVVVVKKELLGKTKRAIPSMLDYQKHITGKSSFNTPPVFAIYVCWLTLKWIEEQGGLTVLGKRNEEKAKLLYDEIDRNDLFDAYIQPGDRSQMNVTFTINDESKTTDFYDFCAKRNIVNINGHRSVGGFRASIYNAMDIEGVEILVKAMKDFEHQL